MLVIRGVVPVVPTPFHPDESIDFESFRKVVDWIAGSNLAGMCLPAYGSEFYKLSDIERDELVAAAIEVCDGRVPVIAQANHTSTRLAS
jgi:4-hydroxy-tetrahydrodipicolinate synthase